MNNYGNEIIVGASGIALAVTSWFLGAKQAAKNESKRVDNEANDILTKGADQIVDTSNKLIQSINSLLEQRQQELEVEKERVRVEREHRADCEEKLKLFEQRINELEKKV